jgi:tripartite-type tricarboxylate transporter receptor subunit TctC
VIDLLAKEIKRVLSEPGMFEKFDALGFTIVGSTPAQFAEHIKRETARWPKVIKELGITAG